MWSKCITAVKPYFGLFEATPLQVKVLYKSKFSGRKNEAKVQKKKNQQ